MGSQSQTQLSKWTAIMVAVYNFWRNCQTVFQHGYTNLHSHQQYMRVLISSYPGQNLLLTFFLIVTILEGMSLVIWILTYLMINDTGHHFICLLASMSFLENCSFKSFIFSIHFGNIMPNTHNTFMYQPGFSSAIIVTRWGIHDLSHFSGEETEAQSSGMICPRGHSLQNVRAQSFIYLTNTHIAFTMCQSREPLNLTFQQFPSETIVINRTSLLPWSSNLLLFFKKKWLIF